MRPPQSTLASQRPGDPAVLLNWSCGLGQNWRKVIPVGAALAHNVPKMVHGNLLSEVPLDRLLVSSNTRPLQFRNGRPEER